MTTPFAPVPLLADPFGHTLGAATDVVVGVVLGNSSAPAVRAEHDRRHLAEQRRWSQVIVLLRLGKSIDDRANVLRPVGGAHEDDIRGIHDDRIGQPQRYNEPCRPTNEPSRPATRDPARHRLSPRPTATDGDD